MLFRSPLKKTKELFNTLVPTQESIVATADNFILLSTKGHTNELCALWKQRFNIASSKQKLSFLYLLNHIIQSSWKDEGKLKKVFSDICEKSFEKAYKLSDEIKIKQEIVKILNVWKDRKIFPEEYINQIETTLKTNSLKSIVKDTPERDIEIYKHLILSKPLLSLEENLRILSEWDEKLLLTKEALELIAQEDLDCNEIEITCKFTDYKKAIAQRRKYAKIVSEQRRDLAESEDNQQLREVIQLRTMQDLIEEVKKKEEGIVEYENPKI